ncbi:MAG: HypC/HybG/HupF family hydrogenase formation chaperone [bacterium]
MCLGIPGQVTRIDEVGSGLTMGTVDFAGVTKEVCLACLPETRIGDWVIVHVGFAITRVDEDEAREVFRILKEMGEIGELDASRPGDPDGRAGP